MLYVCLCWCLGKPNCNTCTFNIVRSYDLFDKKEHLKLSEILLLNLLAFKSNKKSAVFVIWWFCIEQYYCNAMHMGLVCFIAVDEVCGGFSLFLERDVLVCCEILVVRTGAK